MQSLDLVDRSCKQQERTSVFHTRTVTSRRNEMQNINQTVNRSRFLTPELRAQYGPNLLGPLPGPKARAVVEADDRLMSPSYTRSYPLVAKRGRGVRIEDVDGNEFLDFAAGIAVCSTGHCHPEGVSAIPRQAAELIHMSGTDFY